MIPSPTLPWFELARFRRNRLTRAAIAAVCIVPLLYGALYVWANLDPTGRLDQVQAAVVNHDEMIEVDDRDGNPQPVAVGRLLAGNLISDDSKHNYDWVLTDANDALEGLADGTYKAVLTIPENLSSAATSTGGDPAEAVQGRLDLKTNDAVNFVNGQIADRILLATRAALNAQVTETYLDNLYLGFTDIKASLLEAADGAGQLRDGAHLLSDGAGELASGLRQISDGARALNGGASQLADGLGTIESRTRTLPADTRRLADGAEQVAGGTAELNALVQQVTGVVTGGTGQATATLTALESTLRGLAEDCRDAATPGVDCAAIDQAADRTAALRANVGTIGERAGELGDQSNQLAAGARLVADGNRQLADQVPALVSGLGDAAGGARQLRDGSRALVPATATAADGGQRLSDGALALADGARELQIGLDDGSDKIPGYGDEERKKLAEVAATPVTESADRLNAVASYGDGLAPYFMALALWVGALAIYLLLRPLSARAIASTTGSVRTALAGFAPGAALSLVQVALLIAALVWLVGVSVAQPWLLLGFGALTGLVFTAINQAFIAWFGGAGRFLAIVFVCLQLTAAGGTYPIETSPAFFGFLHDLLPMTYAVHGLRAATAGGTAGVGFDAFALVLFGLAGLFVTVLAAKRQQRVTITRLHPALVV